MNDNTNEPVEISTRMADGEWTPESLAEQLSSYQDKLRAMGAPESEIETAVETLADGSATVKVSWHRVGLHTFAEMGQSTVPEAENSRGHGEIIPPGDATEDSKGLGAAYGDAERSTIDEPPTRRAMEALDKQVDPDLLIFTTEEGKTYVEDANPTKN